MSKKNACKPLSPQKRAARIRAYRKLASQWDLIIEYKGSGLDYLLESAMQKIAGSKQFSGSGYCFVTNTRNLHFTFDTKALAYNAQRRIKYRESRFLNVKTKLSSSKSFFEGLALSLENKKI